MASTTAQRTVSKRGGYEIVASKRFREEWLTHATPYSTAMWLVRGQIDIAGDLVQAVRDQLARPRSTGSIDLHLGGSQPGSAASLAGCVFRCGQQLNLATGKTGRATNATGKTGRATKRDRQDRSRH